MKKVVDLLMLLVSLGGKYWEKKDFKRVYFNFEILLKVLGIEVDYYNTGNICSICVDGKKWSNCQGKKLLQTLKGSKVFYDLVSNEWKCDFKYAGFDYRNYVEMAATRLKEQLEKKIAEIEEYEFDEEELVDIEDLEEETEEVEVLAVCPICGKEMTEENENDFDTAYYYRSGSEEHICKECLNGLRAGLVYCRGCGSEACGCVKPDSEILEVWTRDDFGKVVKGFICKENAKGNTCKCECCGELHICELLNEFGICSECEKEDN